MECFLRNNLWVEFVNSEWRSMQIWPNRKRSKFPRSGSGNRLYLPQPFLPLTEGCSLRLLYWLNKSTRLSYLSPVPPLLRPWWMGSESSLSISILTKDLPKGSTYLLGFLSLLFCASVCQSCSVTRKQTRCFTLLLHLPSSIYTVTAWNKSLFLKAKIL